MEVKSIAEQLDATEEELENKKRYFLIFYAYTMSDGSHGFGYFNSVGKGFPSLESVTKYAKETIGEKYHSTCVGIALTGVKELSEEDFLDFTRSEEAENVNS